jgi:ABC-type branched-subunit amino acid transport system ATPase component/ABC-type branched-subunit amino acid transport system permease subunit
MANYINFLFLGLGNGAVFAALAMALVVTYRSSGVLNLATGAQALYASYTYGLLRTGRLLLPIPGVPTISVGGPMAFAPAVVLTLAIQALLGIILWEACFRPLRHQRAVAKTVASLGVMGLLTALVNLQVGAQQLLVAPIYPQNTFTIGSVRLPADRLWFAATIIGVALLLGAIYRFTRFGLATRASAETEVGALVTGLSPENIALANWAISGAVAGLAGILIGPLVPLIPGSYTLFIVPALAAAVVGRLYSLTPAVIAGLLLGALESVCVYLSSRYSAFPSGAGEVLPLVMVLAVLLLRGRPLPTRGQLIQPTLGKAPRPRHILLPVVVGVPIAVLVLVLLQQSFRDAYILSLILAVLGLSLVVVTGYVGQISLAQLALAGVAGFLLSTFAHTWGIPFPFAPLLAALAATVVGVVFGLPALRIRGLFVAIVTLVLAVAIEAVWFQNNSLDGSSGGEPIPDPRLFGFDLGIGSGLQFPRIEFGLLCIFVLVVVAIGVAKLRVSRLGSAMLAVRANERSAAAAGINVVRIKLIGFAIGAFIAGISGCLMAYMQTNVTFETFDALVGLLFFSTVFVAGITSVSGAILGGLGASGGLLFVTTNHVVNFGNWYGILLGIGVVQTVIFNPEGAVGPMYATLDKLRRRFGPSPSVPDLAAASSSETPVAEALPVRPSVPAPVSPVGVRDGPLLQVQELSVHYGGVIAVNEVSFSVPQGQIVGLIGPNGAGKTTLIDALSGFARYHGHVSLEGQSLDGLPPHRRAARGLGRTFQSIDLYEDLSVEENVIVGQHLARGKGQEELAAVLGSLGLSAFRERNVGELSQGQRQLVSIARALAGQPRLLLLDEPAAGLDSTESEWLAARLRDVRDTGVTILLIDHDMSLVLGLCDQLYVLNFGLLIASGSPDQIRIDPSVVDAYLGATHSKEAVT